MGWHTIRNEQAGRCGESTRTSDAQILPRQSVAANVLMCPLGGVGWRWWWVAVVVGVVDGGRRGVLLFSTLLQE